MHCKLSWYICIYSDNLGCQVSLFTISIPCPWTCSSMAGILCILFVQHTICMYSCMYNWLKYMYWLLFSFYIIIPLQRILIIKLLHIIANYIYEAEWQRTEFTRHMLLFLIHNNYIKSMNLYFFHWKANWTIVVKYVK